MKSWNYGKPFKWRGLNKTQEFVIVNKPDLRRLKQNREKTQLIKTPVPLWIFVFGCAKSSRILPFLPYFHSDLIIRSWRQESTFLFQSGFFVVKFELKTIFLIENQVNYYQFAHLTLQFICFS